MPAEGDKFPVTRQSAIIALRSKNALEQRDAMERIANAYWRPVYKYLRIKWRKSMEDAADLTQGFFTAAIEKEFFRSYDPQKARFRTFLRTCLDGYVSNEQKAAKRLKRGGDVQILSLDFENAEGEIQQREIPAPGNMEEYFHAEWIRNLFSMALEEFRKQCETRGKTMQYAVFERYDIESDGSTEKPTYAGLAEEFGLTSTTVTNYLAFARREFRRIVLQTLRDITSTEEEFRQEARSLLGIDPT